MPEQIRMKCGRLLHHSMAHSFMLLLLHRHIEGAGGFDCLQLACAT